MVKDEPMQTEPIYLSSKHDTESEYPMSDRDLADDDDAQNQALNQLLVNPNDPADAAKVTISS